jgi:hypothetical protein
MPKIAIFTPKENDMPPPAGRPQSPNSLVSNGPPSALQSTGVKEVIDYTFYSRVQIVSATVANYPAFNTAGTDPLVSNFEGAGQMPAGQAFHVKTLRVVIRPQIDVLGVINLMSYCSLLFTKENAKKYAYAPLWAFPSGVGVTAETTVGLAAPAAPATGLSRGNNGIPSLGNVYQFSFPVILYPQQPFNITITCGSTACVLLATQDVYVAMDGILERNII